jgi:CheY-like chemotaxis protein
MRTEKPILLVEDDRVDAVSVQRAFKKLKITNPLKLVLNGEEALDFLRHPENDKPCIILLDLDMPRMNGIEFLRIAKQDSRLKRIPVVVLTSSQEECDKVESFNLGVAGYIIKPSDYLQFIDVLSTIDLYWTLSELPNED